MRVGLLLYEVDKRAGMQSQLTRLIPQLEAQGVAVRVVSTAAPRDLRALRGLPVPGSPATPVVRLPFTRTPAFELAARAWLAAQGGIDVLWGAGWHESLHAARIGAASGTPVVARYACSGSHGDFAALARRSDARPLLLRVARHLCISHEVREEALAYGLPEERLVHLPNAIEVAAWEREVEPAALPWRGCRVVLFLGRLTAQKRVDVLLSAFARLLPAAPDARLALCGEGPLRAALEAQARALELGDRVAFLGVRSDVLALHRAASAFVLPSDAEGIPNTLLEALAAGTPAVASDVGGTRDVLRPDRDGLLVPPGDAEALAAALGRLLEDPALARRLAASGRARVREEFALPLLAGRYPPLFAAAAATGGSARARLPEALGRALRRLSLL
ncbi:MAG: glycosyltransferase [Planctomycetota bacterium]